MKSKLYLGAIAMFLGASAIAEDGNPYNGIWKVSYEVPAPMRQGAKIDAQGTLTIKDQGGTWKTYAWNPYDACIGLSAPIAIQSATADELVFKIEKAKTFNGCADSVGTVKRAGENAFTGDFDKTFKLTLERK